MRRYNKLILSLIIVFLLSILPLSVQGSNLEKETRALNNEITVDLKARVAGGDWKDSLNSLDVGTVIEFKVTVDIPRSYFWLGILVELPTTSNGPMFDYRVGSMSPTIINEEVGLTYANDEEVSWSWIDVEPPFSETMTFKAKVKKGASKNVNLIVGGGYGENGDVREDEGSDTLKVNSKTIKSINHNFKEMILNYFPGLEKIVLKFAKIFNLQV